MEDIEYESLEQSDTEETEGFWRRRWKIVLPLVAALAGIVAIMAWGMLNQSPATLKSGFTRTGKPAPNFTLTTFGGEEISLAQLKGEPVVVNFWASWCGPCRIEAPHLEAAWRRFKDDGVMFVGIDIQDTRKDALDYIDEFDITYPNAPDDTGLTSIEYGVGGIPVTFFIDREGVVARRFVGALKETQLVAWTEELIVGVAPSGDAEGENREDFFELDDQQN